MWPTNNVLEQNYAFNVRHRNRFEYSILLTLQTMGNPSRKQDMITAVLYMKDLKRVAVSNLGYSSANALNRHSTIENWKRRNVSVQNMTSLRTVSLTHRKILNGSRLAKFIMFM